MARVAEFQVEKNRKFLSATHEEIQVGATTDIYFVKTLDILRAMGLENTTVTAEIFARKSGVIAGVGEVLNLLKDKEVEVWALPEGTEFQGKDVLMRIKGKYSEFGLFETTLLGFLASSSGWATAAKLAKEAAGDCAMSCFGARHVHPAVAPVMERAALVGGADSASCILGAKLFGQEPAGTAPHALILIVGDTVEAALAYHQVIPLGELRLILVDTFKDEAEESLRVAQALGKDLDGIRLDTPSERGGVTPDLIKEVRQRLDKAGFSHVKIFVSGGLYPEKISLLKQAGADAFGVGSYISGASPIDMTMDIKEIRNTPIAKRGRIPGILDNPKLEKVK
ncbi:MAG: nicotinate phosphoribosyltransferase [Desulfitobacteriaceae bacterium]|nr:nicotinate phosphoribosyltransferase [Desulfitobacteriaceae bacterium]